MPPGKVGVHPDHLAGDNLEQGILKAHQYAPDYSASHGVGLEQHQRLLNTGVGTHDLPLGFLAAPLRRAQLSDVGRPDR
jgi:hypothetical protein